MGKHRDAIPSRVSRKVVEFAYAFTLFGNKELKKKFCRICQSLKPLDAFYLKSKRDKKHDDDVRDECITCWDKHKGKDPKTISTPPTNDLMNFFDNGESDERRVSLGRKISTKNSGRVHSTRKSKENISRVRKSKKRT